MFKKETKHVINKLVCFHSFTSGMGTSAVVNTFINRAECKSGFNIGRSVTEIRQYMFYGQLLVCDTPFNDKLEVIKGIKIIFVITFNVSLERISEYEINEMKKFVKKNPNMHYGIVVNKASKNLKNNEKKLYNILYNILYDDKKENMTDKMSLFIMDYCDELDDGLIDIHPNGDLMKKFVESVKYN